MQSLCEARIFSSHFSYQDMATQELNGEHLRRLFGLKLKQIRRERKLSLKDVAERTDLSISYLSEIEKGKKYPKPEKIFDLSRALDISFDELVSSKVDESLDPLTSIFQSSFLKDFPFEMFGIEQESLIDVFSHSPERAGALIRAFLEIIYGYDMRVEHWMFAALRAYQKMYGNYFEDLEQSAQDFLAHHGWKTKHTITMDQMHRVLQKEYKYIVDETTLPLYPDLKRFRSVFVPPEKRGRILKQPHLLINPRLLPRQKTFIMAREVAFAFLGMMERPRTSSWLTVESFDQVLNNFRASYFAGALMMNRETMIADIQKLFLKKQWDEKHLRTILTRYEVTPEMFLFRLTELAPKFFGLDKLHFFRFNHDLDKNTFRLMKFLNMSQGFVHFGLEENEAHCRRWLPISLLKNLTRIKQQPLGLGNMIAVQRARIVGTDTEYFTIAFARSLALNERADTSVAIGFLMDERFKSTVKFWSDPSIPIIEVNETCERCPLTDAQCHERVAPPFAYRAAQHTAAQEKALTQMSADVRM